MIKQKISNIYQLGVKELWGLIRDPMMLLLIVFAFTGMIYSSTKAVPDSLNKASIAIIDEDRSALSYRIRNAFFPPMFKQPDIINFDKLDTSMDLGDYTFILDIPPDFERKVIAGQVPSLQLNVDATRMSQAFVGNSYIQQIITTEVNNFVNRSSEVEALPVDLVMRMEYNENLSQSWFNALNQVINNITMLSIILTGAALIREREHGTIEHLLVMPVTPAEIMLAKIWSMGLVVLVATAFSLVFVVNRLLEIPIAGSLTLFLFGTAIYLFATTAMGIFLATIARSMAQFGILLILVLLPLQVLSGGLTPKESMPEAVQLIMSVLPTPHFIQLSKAILFKGAPFSIVWSYFVILIIIGGVLFFLSLQRFRKTINSMA